MNSSTQPEPASEIPPEADRESLRGLRMTVERAPIGIAHIGLDGTFLLANDRLCTILGYSREELLTRTFQEITFPDDLPLCLALTDQLVVGSIPSYQHEKRFLRPDGAEVWVRVTVSAVRRPNGRPAFLIGVAEDISEQRAVEAARRDAEERLHAALEASQTGTFRWDLGSGALDWDQNLDRLFGLEPGVTARSLKQFLDLVHPDDRPRVTEACWLSVDAGADILEEFRVVWPDGTVHWLCDRGRTVLDAQGAPLYMTGACTDITARKRLEAERLTAERERERLLALERRARIEAEHAIKLRDEVMAVVAHDLRNPVHTIALTASTLLEVPLRDEQRRRQLGIVRRAAEGMEHLISDLMDATRLESGSLAIKRTPVLLPPVLHESLELFEEQARHRQLDLACEIEGGVGTIVGDRERLMQVLSNLLSNAIKFTPPRGSVVLRASRADAEIHVSVRDTGPGIPAENLPRVFERFWQADRTARSGAGLGLVIAKGIVEAHGGHIWVESLPGQGTTFHLTIPCTTR